MNNRWFKLIRSLQQKKFRKKEGLFLVEGTKSVSDLCASDYKVQAIFYTEKFQQKHSYLLTETSCYQELTKPDRLKQAGTLMQNDTVLAVAETQSFTEGFSVEANEIVLMLDDVRDPGNLGTILRLADWYGIHRIICSPTSADMYNPKVVIASMGSFARVQVHYLDLEKYLSENQGSVTVCGAFMEGENVHNVSLKLPTIVVMGNESNGIRQELFPYINQKISIPQYGSGESLNVAMATGIICDNLMRMKN